MRTRPHPIRVVWKTAQVVMVAAVTALVLTSLRRGSMTDDGASVALAWISVGATIVVLVTARSAAARLPAMRACQGTAMRFIARSPEDVWNFIRPAESAVQTQTACRRGFTVPGTGPGVGEQQGFVSDGLFGLQQAGVVEVVEERPGAMAIVRSVTGLPATQRYEVVPVEGGADLYYTDEIPCARWSPWRNRVEQQVRRGAQEYVTQVKRLVEALPRPGEETPPPEG